MPSRANVLGGETVRAGNSASVSLSGSVTFSLFHEERQSCENLRPEYFRQRKRKYKCTEAETSLAHLRPTSKYYREVKRLSLDKSHRTHAWRGRALAQVVRGWTVVMEEVQGKK